MIPLTNCIDITVNIANYSAGNIYTLYIRPKGSIGIPTTFVTTTQPMYVYEDMPLADYEVGIKTTCPGSVDSVIVWQVPSNVNCAKPALIMLGPEMQVTLPDVAVVGFEWRVDYLNWSFVNSGGIAIHLVDLGPLIATRIGSLIDIQVRVKCSLGSFSVVEHLYHASAPQTTSKISLLQNLCENNQFAGALMRLTIGGNDADLEQLVYDNASDPAVTILTYQRTGNMDTDIAAYKTALNGYNLIRHYNIASPTVPIKVSMDFISHNSPLGSGVPGTVPCGNYPLTFSII